MQKDLLPEYNVIIPDLELLREVFKVFFMLWVAFWNLGRIYFFLFIKIFTIIQNAWEQSQGFVLNFFLVNFALQIVYLVPTIFSYKRFNIFIFLLGFFSIFFLFNVSVAVHWNYLLLYLFRGFIVTFLTNQENLYIVHQDLTFFIT